MAKNILQSAVDGIDSFQQKHHTTAFPYAVVKKYSEDEAGNLGALITYYGFLSLFPLLLVATTIIRIVLRGEPSIKSRFLNSIGDYFPGFHNEIQSNIQSMNKTGLALAIGVLLTIYGARGGANAFQHALNHIWQVPRIKRPGFPKNLFKNLAIIFITGFGFIGAAVLSSYATALERIFILRLIPTLVSLIVLSLMFYILFKLGTAFKEVAKKAIFTSALIAAIGVQILQSVGGYLITHELRHMSTFYGTFAIVLGLLFWLYLQVQVMLYAVEIGSVKALGLWPRSLTGNLTEADKKAYSMLAKNE